MHISIYDIFQRVKESKLNAFDARVSVIYSWQKNNGQKRSSSSALLPAINDFSP